MSTSNLLIGHYPFFQVGALTTCVAVRQRPTKASLSRSYHVPSTLPEASTGVLPAATARRPVDLRGVGVVNATVILIWREMGTAARSPSWPWAIQGHGGATVPRFAFPTPNPVVAREATTPATFLLVAFPGRARIDAVLEVAAAGRSATGITRASRLRPRPVPREANARPGEPSAVPTATPAVPRGTRAEASPLPSPLGVAQATKRRMAKNATEAQAQIAATSARSVRAVTPFPTTSAVGAATAVEEVGPTETAAPLAKA